MAKRVDLHVGVPRAGTTYLQQLLHANRAALAESGVDLVVGHARNLERPATDLANGGETAWRALTKTIEASPDRVLLSWEGFSAVSSEAAERAVSDLAPAEVRVILTVRDPVWQIPSIWQQQIRSGSTQDFEHMVSQIRAGRHADLAPDPVEVADTWAGAVTAAQVRVVVAPTTAESPTGLWELFAAAADLDPAVVAGPAWDERVPDRLSLELLRRVNLALGDRLPSVQRRYRELIRPVVARTATPDVSQRPVTLGYDDRAWAIEQGRTIADQLARRKYAMYGDLDDLVAEPVELPVAGPADDAAVAPLATEMVANLLIALRNARKHIPENEQEAIRSSRAAARRAGGGADDEADDAKPEAD